jgi:23S rRNA (uracil1939-C5)-methyltransferase
MSSVIKLGPKKVVYVSCNPITLERDLKFMTKRGYKVKKIQPVEMFPFTEHVETVCLLEKER